jgi:hypothetical protein
MGCNHVDKLEAGIFYNPPADTITNLPAENLDEAYKVHTRGMLATMTPIVST